DGILTLRQGLIGDGAAIPAHVSPADRDRTDTIGMRSGADCNRIIRLGVGTRPKTDGTGPAAHCLATHGDRTVGPGLGVCPYRDCAVDCVGIGAQCRRSPDAAPTAGRRPGTPPPRTSSGPTGAC